MVEIKTSPVIHLVGPQNTWAHRRPIQSATKWTSA